MSPSENKTINNVDKMHFRQRVAMLRVLMSVGNSDFLFFIFIRKKSAFLYWYEPYEIIFIFTSFVCFIAEDDYMNGTHSHIRCTRDQIPTLNHTMIIFCCCCGFIFIRSYSFLSLSLSLSVCYSVLMEIDVANRPARNDRCHKQ